MTGYTKVASPLHALVSGKNASKRNRPTKWTKQCQEALKEVQRLCTSASISKPFKLHADASGIALGALLYQVQDGVDHVIGYGRQGLNKGEANYTAHKLEFLALK